MIQLQHVSLSRICCPIDFSQASYHSLRMALALGRVYQAEVFVCYCLAAANGREAGTDWILQQIDEMDFDHLLFEPRPMPKWRFVALEGNPQTAVSKAAESYGVDLIVTCPSKHSNLHQWLSSTVRAISISAPCPVLVVKKLPPLAMGCANNRTEPEKIMVVCDFSIDSELALAHGFSLARKFHADLHTLLVLPQASMLNLGLLSKAALVPMGQKEPFPPWFSFCFPPEILNQSRFTLMRQEGQSMREIFLYAKEEKVDLICLGVHWIRSEMNPLCGSNGELLLNKDALPVLLVRPLNPFGAANPSFEMKVGAHQQTSPLN